MLSDSDIAMLCNIGQSIAFSDDRHGELFRLIADGYGRRMATPTSSPPRAKRP
ncbi:hypothetical protein L6654_05105 [Bradyrhizobium sp. WYCCWR 13023]|uniref:Uncharacterized protein n=1 Tax=Bradyrhizobium zhengyangense TaxID=2911009 RepID=A0A9X1R6R6_9BRAD|nr:MULTISPECIES: hypothetical protein [Bradyrhizobium]MCG2626000.1 hypothetical protein [Bradyrhizobium zhengyangense]MCG2645251.1 hypothetical protein [Bradyrhizobium zhengyangense]MCG2671449.1 hypothetical protein [Bradyrhizobium zhengyangense]